MKIFMSERHARLKNSETGSSKFMMWLVRLCLQLSETSKPYVELMSIRLFTKYSMHTVIKGFFPLKSTGFDEFRYYNTFTNLKFIVHNFKLQQNAARNFLYCIIEFVLRNIISVTAYWVYTSQHYQRYCIIEFTLGNITSVTALLSSHLATLSALLHYWVHTWQHYQRYCIIEFALRNIISVTALLSSRFATLSALLHYWVHTWQHYQRYCMIEFTLGNIISVTAYWVHTWQHYQRYCIIELTITGVITILLYKVTIFQAFP
jgi:hypothetical protein